MCKSQRRKMDRLQEELIQLIKQKNSVKISRLNSLIQTKESNQAIAMILHRKDLALNIHGEDQDCRTAIQTAVVNEDLPVLKCLITEGVTVENINFTISPLHFALKCVQPSALKLLLKLCNIDMEKLESCLLAYRYRDILNYRRLAQLNSLRKCGVIYDILFSYGFDGKAITGSYMSGVSSVLLMDLKCHHGTCEAPTYFEKIKILGCTVQGISMKIMFANAGLCRTVLKDNLQEKCHEELAQMEENFVNTYPRYSIKDLLFLTRNKFARLTEQNEDIQKIFHDDDLGFEAIYPEYGLILNFKYKKAVYRRLLLENAKNNFQLLISYRMPEQCSEMVLEFFNEKELVHFNACEWETGKYFEV